MSNETQPPEAVSCTRVGLIIILLSGLGLALLGPLENAVVNRPLGRYIALRTVLSAQLAEIDKNPCLE